MDWQNDGESTKSDGAVNKLVKDVLCHPKFMVSDLKNFDARRENRRQDAADSKSPLLDGFKEANVTIDVPSGNKHVPPQAFSIPGMHYQNLTSAIRTAFSGPLASKLHFTPYKMFHKSDSDKSERVYSEIYDSDVLLQEHDRVQRLPLHPDDRGCKRERIVAALMCWSDMTHLTDFGSAKLWPIYMMLGNLSKYVRANPNSGACMHVAYLPSLPDSFQEFAAKFHRKWETQKDEIRKHCKRELAQAAWKLLLDDDFLHAYKYGMVVKCSDGIERRVYPRFLTYSADYPEK